MGVNQLQKDAFTGLGHWPDEEAAFMNTINRIGNNPILAATPKSSSRSEGLALNQDNATDTVEISTQQPLDKAFRSGEIRQGKVASIRQQIENGTYEDNAKIDAVVNKLMDIL